MRRKDLIYLIAFALLVLNFLFFIQAYRELIRYSEFTNRSTTVYRSFQNLSLQLNNAAVFNSELNKAINTLKGTKLFFTDSQSIIQELNFLKSTVRDSINIQYSKKLDKEIRSEISWLMSSNVPDSIIHHKSSQHISAFQNIDFLLKQGTKRTFLLLKQREKNLHETIRQVSTLIILFIFLSGFLIFYSTINFFKQKSKTKSKEKELEISNRLLKNAQHMVHLGNWEYKMATADLYWSDEMYSIWGVFKNSYQVNYQKYFETIHPDDKGRFTIEEAAAFSGKKELDIEHRIVLWDGSVKWVHEKGILVTSTQGMPLTFEGTVLDITERKKVEEELERSERRFRALVENDEGIIAMVDENMHTFYRSPSAERVTGFTSEDRESGVKIDEIHPDDKESIMNCLEEARANPKKAIFVTYRIKHKSGHYIWLEGTFTNMFLDTDIEAIVVNMRDITQRKKVEEKLKESELHYRSLIEQASDTIYIADASLKYMDINPSGCNMLGYSREEFLQLSAADLLFEEDLNAYSLKFEELKSGQRINYERRMKRKDGTAVEVETNGKMMENGSFIMFARDITQRKNEEFQKLLLADISQLFNEPIDLLTTLQKVLKRLVAFGKFNRAEAWLICRDQKRINLAARFPPNETILNESADIKGLNKGEGLPGLVWKTKAIQSQDENKDLDIPTVYGLPIIYKDEVIGVFVVELNQPLQIEGNFFTLFENLGFQVGAQIKRKQVEQELNQIFSFAPDIICIAGLDGYFKKINQAACDLLEYTEEELLSIPYANIMHQDDIVKAAEMFRQNFPTVYFENRYFTKSGKMKWFAWTASPSNDEGLFFAIAKDITEKKELENLLNKTNDLARIGSWELDLLKDATYWSDMTREILEVGPDIEPVRGTGIKFYKEGKNRDLITQKIQDAIEFGFSWNLELQIITARGNEKWIRVIGETEFVNGKCLRVYGSFQDIDVRKSAEIEAIKNLEEKNTILESIGDAFFAVDKNWIVTYWNKQAETILHKAKNEILGFHLWEVFSDSIDSLSYQKYHQALKTNLVVHFEDHYAPLAKWYEISGYPSDNGLSVYFKDVTERKISEIRLNEMHENLQKQAKKLAISNTELEQFAYVASHDLQEPLRMVTSFLSLIDKKYGDIIGDTGKKYIYFAVDGAKRMRQLILDLLAFSRIGSVEDPEEKLDLIELVAEIQILFRNQIEEKNAIIQVGELPVINAYKAPLRQVFQNLIGNALKYTSGDLPTQIHITSKEFKNHWQFVVADNGIGIAEEYFDKIFVIFQRLHNKDEFSGTGMGLAVSKKIIENLGGKIWVKSTEGKGSSFYFNIPKLKVIDPVALY